MVRVDGPYSHEMVPSDEAGGDFLSMLMAKTTVEKTEKAETSKRSIEKFEWHAREKDVTFSGVWKYAKLDKQ